MASVGGYGNVPVIRQEIRYTPKPKPHYGKFWRFLGSVLMLLIIVILICNTFKAVRGGSTVTFSGFLNWLSTVRPMQIEVHIEAYHIGGNWGPLDFLRIFFDGLSTGAGAVAWLGANVINLVLFAGQFIYFLLA